MSSSRPFLVIVLPLLALGCDDASVALHPRVVRNATSPCSSTVNGATAPMDTYIVEVHLDGRATAGESCLTCFARESCALLERQCVCGAARETSAPQLAEAISGIRLGPFPEGAYCIRVIAVERPSSAVTSTTDAPCACDPFWLTPNLTSGPAGPIDLDPPGRLCAYSIASQTLTSSASLELEVFCRDDPATSGSPLDTPAGQCAGNPFVFQGL